MSNVRSLVPTRSSHLKTLLLVLVTLVVLVGIAIAFAAARRKTGAGAPEGPWPFYAKRPLSAPEQVLYHRLVKALPEHIVLAQVQVSRILGVKKGFNFHEWNNRVNRLSYDFVVCSKDSTVIAAIELDDKTHEAEGRADTDRKKERATAAAGVKLIRWHVRPSPTKQPFEPLLLQAPNHSIERTFQRPLRALWPAAHVER